MSNTAIIETKGLKIGYRLRGGKEKVIGAGIDFELHCGELVALLGLNGCGKSTLIKTLCGFQPQLAGEISLKGRALSDYSMGELALEIGVVLTEKIGAGGISVYDLVSLGRYPYTDFMGKIGAKDDEIISASMESVGILDKANSYVSELSDGERQRAMIAKALAQQCPIIILDEPTAFLDVVSRIETIKLLSKLAHTQNKAVLLSTHDIELAFKYADRFLLQRRLPTPTTSTATHPTPSTATPKVNSTATPSVISPATPPMVTTATHPATSPATPSPSILSCPAERQDLVREFFGMKG